MQRPSSTCCGELDPSSPVNKLEPPVNKYKCVMLPSSLNVVYPNQKAQDSLPVQFPSQLRSAHHAALQHLHHRRLGPARCPSRLRLPCRHHRPRPPRSLLRLRGLPRCSVHPVDHRMQRRKRPHIGHDLQQRTRGWRVPAPAG